MCTVARLECNRMTDAEIRAFLEQIRARQRGALGAWAIERGLNKAHVKDVVYAGVTPNEAVRREVEMEAETCRI